jgi:uncharacterized damage-inducible protein DinB
MFRDLYAHQEWADSVVWEAVMGSEAARGDKRIRDLLAHLHMTQHAFLSQWTKRDFVYRDADAFPAPSDVLAYAREYHAKVHDFINGSPDLEQAVVLPWASYFHEDPGHPTLRETMMQVPMHSTYHRGQVNARLREIGGEPPLTDYIAWIWKRKPAPAW